MDETKFCNVCGKMRPLSQMGDGIRIPHTTCLDCYRHRQEANAREKGIEPAAAKVKGPDPVIEYLSTFCHVCGVTIGEKHKPFCSVGNGIFGEKGN